MNYDNMPRRTLSQTHLGEMVPGRATPGEPLKTHMELAEEFGISCPKLSSEMKTSTVKPPAPFSKTKAGLWYRPSEMRKWWKTHKATLDAKA